MVRTVFDSKSIALAYAKALVGICAILIFPWRFLHLLLKASFVTYARVFGI